MQEKSNHSNNNCNGIPLNYKNNTSTAAQTTPVSVLEYYKKIDYDAENLAKKYTTEFMSSKDFIGQCQYP